MLISLGTGAYLEKLYVLINYSQFQLILRLFAQSWVRELLVKIPFGFFNLFLQ